MPTSDHFNITPILTVVRNANPRSILDVGCGFGKYGTLFREYLDVWDERLTRDRWQLRMVGIEAFPSYANAIHREVYDEVLYEPAQKVLASLGNFDLILIADVIEHLEQQEARDLTSRALDIGKLLLISTPIEFYAQEDICSNDFERHRCHFTAADFPPGCHVHTVPLVGCHLYVASRQPLDPALFALADPAGIVYLRSRRKLGKWGLPLSVTLRGLCRLLS